MSRSAETPRDAVAVCVGNLGKYNEGELVDAWLTLPMAPADLDRALRERVGLETDPAAAHRAAMAGERVYEEYLITDFEYAGGLEAVGFHPGTYEDLRALNALAWCISNCDDLPAVKAYMEQQGGDCGPLEYANACLQAGRIPYYAYDFDPAEFKTLEEGYARSYDKSVNVGNEPLEYVDVEKYGRQMAAGGGTVLSKEGHLETDMEGPALDRYTLDEVLDMLGPDDGLTWEDGPDKRRDRIASMADELADAIGYRREGTRDDDAAVDALYRAAFEGPGGKGGLGERDRAAVRVYMAEQGFRPGALEYANTCMQAGEIPFFEYPRPFWTYPSLEAAYGDALLDELGLPEESEPREDHPDLWDSVDWEAYGRELTHYLALCDWGYLDLLCNSGPDLDRYSLEEILDDMEEDLTRTRVPARASQVEEAQR